MSNPIKIDLVHKVYEVPRVEITPELARAIVALGSTQPDQPADAHPALLEVNRLKDQMAQERAAYSDLETALDQAKARAELLTALLDDIHLTGGLTAALKARVAAALGKA